MTGCGALVTAPMLPYRRAGGREPHGRLGKLDPQDSGSGSDRTGSGVAVSSRDWFGRGGSGRRCRRRRSRHGPGGRLRPPAGPRRRRRLGRPGVAGRRRGPLVPDHRASSSRWSCSSRSLAQLWTEVLWFDSVGFAAVFGTELVTKVAAVRRRRPARPPRSSASSLVIGYRTRPIYAPVVRGAAEPRPLPRGCSSRCAASPRSACPLVLGLFAGSAAASQWQTFLLWRNGVAVRHQGPAVRPRHRLLRLHPAVAALRRRLPDAWSLVLGARSPRRSPTTSTAACSCRPAASAPRRPRACTCRSSLAALVLVRAASLLARPLLPRPPRTPSCITGITYTDATRCCPTKAILAVAAVMCARAVPRRRSGPQSWRLPVVGVGLLVVIAVVVGGIYPALVQSLQGQARRRSRSRRRTSSATSTRPGRPTGSTDVETHAVQRRRTTATQAASCATTPTTIPGIRLLDPNVVAPTFKQLQADQGATTQFPDALDVDRYTIDGKLQRHRHRGARARPRRVPDGQRNWLNDHTVYTHGFGVVAAYGNQRDADGQPVFFEQNIPPTGALGDVRAADLLRRALARLLHRRRRRGRPPRELDYPDSSASRAGRTPRTPATAACAIGSLRRQGWPTRSSTASRTSCSRTPSTPTPGSSTTARRASGSSRSPRG